MPEGAFVSYGGKQYVFVVKGEQQFELTEVKAGTTEKGYTAGMPEVDSTVFVTRG